MTGGRTKRVTFLQVARLAVGSPRAVPVDLSAVDPQTAWRWGVLSVELLTRREARRSRRMTRWRRR